MEIKAGEGQHTEPPCNVRLVPDTPAPDDEFGSHERIAESILHFVENDKGGKSIAITGRWGSGKSTIVSLMRKKASKASDDRVRIVSYDAWIHDGDPLRRSFLEELIAILGMGDRTTRWINPEKWADELEDISRGKDTTRTESRPILGIGGALLAILLLMTPVGIALLSYDNNSHPVLAGLTYKDIGLFFLAMPVITALALLFLNIVCSGIIQIVWRLWRWKIGQSPFDIDKCKSKVSSILNFHTRQVPTAQQTVTYKSPNPSSIEFRNFFSNILEEAFSGGSRRRVVFVVDNLDRIEVEKALEIWSTMRTFFEPFNIGKSSWIKHFWLIVAFDPFAIGELWNQAKPEPSPIQNDSGQDNTPICNEDTANRAVAFLEKSFQVTIEIPPPVLVRWKAFFYKKMSWAFEYCSDVKEDDIMRLYHLFIVARVNPQGRPPTPRGINIFINKVGALYCIWGNSIPILILGVYALYQHCVKDPVRDFENKNTFNSALVDWLNYIRWDEFEYQGKKYDWKQYLAAVYYGLEPEEATHMLYGEKVRKALINGDTATLTQLLDAVPGLSSVIQQVIEQNAELWSPSKPKPLANTALCLHSISKPNDKEWEQSWLRLSICVKSVRSWVQIDNNVGKGISYILKETLQSDYDLVAGKVLASLASSAADFKLTDDSRDLKTWLLCVIELMSEIRRQRDLTFFKEHFTPHISVEVFDEIVKCMCWVSVPEEYIEYFSPIDINTVKTEEILMKFISPYEAGKFKDSPDDPIWIMSQMPVEWPWGKLYREIESFLRDVNNAHPATIIGWLGLMSSLAINGQVQSATNKLKSLVKKNIFKQLVDNASRDYPEVTSAINCLLAGGILPIWTKNEEETIFKTSLNKFKNIFTTPEEQVDVVQHLTKLVVKYRLMDRLVDLKKKFPEISPFVRAVYEYAFQLDTTWERLGPNQLFHFTELDVNISPSDFERVVRHLVDKRDLIGYLQNNIFRPDLAEVYSNSLKCIDSSKLDTFENWIVESIQELPEHIWNRVIEQNSSLISFLVELIEAGTSLQLKNQFKQALLSHARQMVLGNAEIPYKADEFNNLVQALNEENMQDFMRELLEVLRKNIGKDLSSIIRLYGEDLLEFELPQDKANQYIKLILDPICSRGNKVELLWILRLFQRNNGILSQVDSKTKSECKKMAQERRDANQAGSETSQLIEQIINCL